MEAGLTLRRLLPCAAALLLLGVVAAGCGGGRDARAATTDPPLQRYSGAGLSFTYPTAWTAYPYQGRGELHFQPIVYLSTQPVQDPCSTQGNTTSCGFPVAHLEPGGVVVVWQQNGIPAMGLGPGHRIEVGGHPASFVDERGGECSRIGADRTIDVAVETSKPPAPFTYLTACLRGPGLARAETAVEALLASTTFTSR
jgi:hypothetical protein